MKIWNVQTHQCLLSFKGHSGWIYSAAFSPDSNTIATASNDNTAKLWDTRTGLCLHTLQGHTDWLTSAAFSPDGNTIVTSSGDHTAKLWQLYPRELEQHSLVELLHLVESGRSRQAEEQDVKQAEEQALLQGIIGVWQTYWPFGGDCDSEGDDA